MSSGHLEARPLPPHITLLECYRCSRKTSNIRFQGSYTDVARRGRAVLTDTVATAAVSTGCCQNFSSHTHTLAPELHLTHCHSIAYLVQTNTVYPLPRWRLLRGHKTISLRIWQQKEAEDAEWRVIKRQAEYHLRDTRGGRRGKKALLIKCISWKKKKKNRWRLPRQRFMDLQEEALCICSLNMQRVA